MASVTVFSQLICCLFESYVGPSPQKKTKLVDFFRGVRMRERVEMRGAGPC